MHLIAQYTETYEFSNFEAIKGESFKQYAYKSLRVPEVQAANKAAVAQRLFEEVDDEWADAELDNVREHLML